MSCWRMTICWKRCRRRKGNDICTVVPMGGDRHRRRWRRAC
jgi:hypothetical protein